MSSLARYGRDGTEAYDLVDRLPSGPARAAAWNAYACQVYADKLSESCPHPSDETARVVHALYDLARVWLARASDGTAGHFELELPPWGAPERSRDQLIGMRNALDALRTTVAYDLPHELAPDLAAIDRRMTAVDELWIDRPTPDLRAGLGGLLVAGIRDAIELGRTLADRRAGD